LLYPDSPYLALIEKREAVLPSEEIQARQLFWNAEKWLDINLDSAITVFNSVYRQYPATYYAEKSVLNIAWIYHHKYYDLDNAIKWYKIFLDEYPESENISFVKPIYNTLVDINKIIDVAPADTTKSESTADSFLEEKPTEDRTAKPTAVNKHDELDK
jgi:outer membrane protein assembly factor BamD (BamD/ComL family)